MKALLASVAIGSILVTTFSPASAGLTGIKNKFRPYTDVIKETVGEKKASLEKSAKEKKTKIVEKAKAKGNKVVTNFGIDTIVATVNGKTVETTDSLLIRLDNLVSAEVIIKMIKLMQADMKFQLDRRQASFEQNKASLEKVLADIQQKMQDLRQKVTKKIQDNIDIYQAQIKGRQDIVNQAKKTRDEDNSTLISVVNTLDAVIGNEVIGGIRDVVVKATAAKKGTAQKDIINLNNQIEKIQQKLGSEQDKLKKALSNPKYTKQTGALMAGSDAVVAALGKLQQTYDDFRNSDFFNYFDDQQAGYATGIKQFTQAAGCEVNLTSYDFASLQGALDKIKGCKKNIINGVASKKDVPYLKQDTKFSNTQACNDLDEESNISDVESCISNFESIPLTSFGDAHVKQ